MRVFFRDYYSKIFNYFWVRIGIILAFLILISVNIYGATQLKLKFDVEWFVGSGSHISDAIDIRDKYYKNRGRDVRVYIFET